MKGINTPRASPGTRTALTVPFAPRGGVCYLAISALARKWNQLVGFASLARLRINLPEISFNAESILLYSSSLLRKGASYDPVFTVKLES